jgi:hypothetical protein
LKLRVYVLLGVLFIRNNCGMALKVIILWDCYNKNFPA